MDETGRDRELLGELPRSGQETLPGRLARLERELTKGEAVYSAADLEKLTRLLAETREQLRVLLEP